MKFYLIEVAEGDSSIAGKAIYEYDEAKMAIATFHQKIATAMKSDLYDSELLIVVNSNGYTLEQHLYTKEVGDDLGE